MKGTRLQVMVAEGIGTFTLIFIGVLAISAADYVAAPAGLVNLTAVAFAHGLAIAVMVAAVAAISGGHLNPAVTAGFVATGRLSVVDGALYWIAQLAGAALAAFLLVALVGTGPVDMGTLDLAPGVTFGAGVVLEAVVTFFLVFVIFATAVDERAPKSVFPFAIGLTITLGILGVGPLTGGAINPARAFGPALASGHWNNHLAYWIGPLIGGVLGAMVQHFILMRRAPTPQVAERGGPAPSEQRR